MRARPSLRFKCPLAIPSRILSIALIAISTLFFARVSAQSPTPVEFDVISIKRVDELRPGGGMRTLPDGTFMTMNQPLHSIPAVHLPASSHLVAERMPS
jgi:hypothetical protein